MEHCGWCRQSQWQKLTLRQRRGGGCSSMTICKVFLTLYPSLLSPTCLEVLRCWLKRSIFNLKFAIEFVPMSESQGPNTGAFAETWRKLWDLHNSDLHLLEKENQKLRQKLGLSEEELTERHLTERKPPETVETLKTQSISSDEPQHRVSTLQHQPKSAWARVVPQQPSENDLFHTVHHTERAVEEGFGNFFSGCFWTHVEKLVSNPMFDVAAAACIFLNAVVMACEAQWEGLSVGANLSYSTLNQRHVAAWTSAEPAFVVLGYVFGVLFTLELILKIMGQRGQFCLPETQSQSAKKTAGKNMKSVWTNQKKWTGNSQKQCT